MSKGTLETKEKERKEQEMLDEYDFSQMPGGVRGKYYKKMQGNYTIEVREEDGSLTVHHYCPPEGSVVLDADLRLYFPDSESVNQTLRALVTLLSRLGVQPASSEGRSLPDQPENVTVQVGSRTSRLPLRTGRPRSRET
jgi:hypothetical protein